MPATRNGLALDHLDERPVATWIVIGPAGVAVVPVVAAATKETSATTGAGIHQPAHHQFARHLEVIRQRRFGI
jgi:hypothetical protein